MKLKTALDKPYCPIEGFEIEITNNG